LKITFLTGLIASLVISLGVTAYAQTSQEEEGVCARVKIRISQDVALTRAAFRATLEINNAPENTRIENVAVTLDIRNKADEAKNGVFGIRDPELTGISDVSGGGLVEPGGSAKAVWTIIPTRDAAPDEPLQYFVGGQLDYTQEGTHVSIPLFPATILVRPDPLLVLNYFLVRDVYGDDPFTTAIESSEPFPLGLMMTNQGKGSANNVRITSSQPEIVDNEKGLLIDFKITGTQVNTDQVSPSLTVNLGNIDPGQSAVARWMMLCSLSGRFVEYKASFEHVDPLGDARLSLIDSVSIHELTHAVRIDDPADDSKPDFLVNDIADPDFLPDSLYNSAGGIFPVSQGVNPVVTGAPGQGGLQAALQAVVPLGWVYIQANDPGQENYRLSRVVRSDGREIRVDDNAWTTHRTIRLKGQAPYRQHLVHILDKDSTGLYTLIYEALSTGPVSVGEAKLRSDGEAVELGGTQGLAVTALFDDGMYVETLDRTCGIKVTGQSALEGDRVHVKGVMATGPNGERQINATEVTRVDSGTLEPMGLMVRALWGGDTFYSAASGAGQKGMKNGAGLNTVGLLVRTTGRVVSADASGFVFGDGSSEHDARVLMPEGAAALQPGQFVRVVGIVSCEREGADLLPILRVRRATEVYAENTGPAITNVQAINVTATTADIIWSTDRQASSAVKIGTVSGNYTQTVSGPDFVTGHTVKLTGLTPGATYYYVAQSKDYYTNITTSSPELSFSTTSAALPALDLTFPTASKSGDVVTADAQLANTGGPATSVRITGIQVSPASVTALTTAPLTFGSGAIGMDQTATQQLQFGNVSASFYVKLTLEYKDAALVQRTLTTAWKKVTLP